MTMFYPFANANPRAHFHGRPSWGLMDLDEMDQFPFPPRHCSGSGPGPVRGRHFHRGHGGRGHGPGGPCRFGRPTTGPGPNFVTTASALADAILPEFFEVVAGVSRPKAKAPAAAAAANPKNAFEVKVDASGFAPDELTVKSVDNCIVVEGKHEEREDEHGYVSRSFVRRYVLPEGVKLENVSCQLTTDGVLILSAPAVVLEPEVPKERSIPITLSGKPAAALVTTVPAEVPQMNKEQELSPSAPPQDSAMPIVENIGDEDTGPAPMSTQ